ncbi:Integrase family protein [Pseudodesulfovibrio profundus]|uniref:Integrase family protein n=1 Tax=Pseudodesulfovibrio profundus TaxID=57320 RepID=A0A2C8FCY1_9BACT|nr:tyrosine-type recombinase/integrase [Pseudodesulfovibrio profundus]SOB60502.1 Integrase family protein [Pseudodesulfovibrio profundus]
MSPRNDNHPPKGSSITVEPIRSLEAISAIKDMLHGKPRDLLLFVIATNNGIRCGDLLRLKVGDLRGKNVDDTIAVKESKTGKTNVLAVNDSVYSALTRFLASGSFCDDAYLFRSQKGDNKPLTIQSVNRMVKTWCREADLDGNYGAHTLRKTFGYVQRVHFGVGFEVLCKRFNHASPAVTMRYLGISDTEVVSILKNSI